MKRLSKAQHTEAKARRKGWRPIGERAVALTFRGIYESLNRVYSKDDGGYWTAADGFVRQGDPVTLDHNGQVRRASAVEVPLGYALDVADDGTATIRFES